MTDARTQIRLATERLVAEHGVEVPLRDIAVAAGQRNNSAVQYHFGSREDLIGAVIAHRNEAIEAHRLELLAEAEAAGTQDEVRTLVELLVVPLLEIPYQQGATHYARFLEQVRNHPAVLGAEHPEAVQTPGVRIILGRLGAALDALPPTLRKLRLLSLATTMFSLLADRERVLEPGSRGGVAPDLSAANVVDVLVAVLTAEPSAAAVEAAASRPRRRARTA